MSNKDFLRSSLLILLLLTLSCLTITERKQQEYSRLVSSVMNVRSSIKGVYPSELPQDFSNSTFLRIVKEKQKPPEDDFEVLSQYRLEVIPKGSYYLLIVRDSGTDEVILFDYSCNFGVEGQVFHSPGKYDLNHLELYDKCKSPSD